jgi:signal transduction histidine kinase
MATVMIGLVFAYSGAALYAWRKFDDRRRLGLPGVARTLHLKLTGAMLLVLILDGAGYLLAVGHVPSGNQALVAVLADIFVAVAMLTITVGLLLPGMIAHSAVQVSAGADRLVRGTLADFARAMRALGRGDLAHAHARVDYVPVTINSRDEVGEMAASFNILQREIAVAAVGLDDAREGLRAARAELIDANEKLRLTIRELREAKDAAEQANAAKSAFLAAMSHELRTPLNAILGFSQMIGSEILGPVGTPAYRDYAKDIHESGTVLLSIIGDVLDMAKIGSGQFELHEEEVDVADLVRGSLKLVRGQAEAAGLTLSADTPGDLPSLMVDETRARQILVNLLSNAIKFTPGPGRVSVTARTAAGGALSIAVEDTGIGMTEAEIALALQPFRQVDSALSRKYQGTGLGLPLAQGLALLHGGQLDVESRPGVGTRVSITFPPERVGLRAA